MEPSTLSFKGYDDSFHYSPCIPIAHRIQVRTKAQKFSGGVTTSIWMAVSAVELCVVRNKDIFFWLLFFGIDSRLRFT